MNERRERDTLVSLRFLLLYRRRFSNRDPHAALVPSNPASPPSAHAPLADFAMRHQQNVQVVDYGSGNLPPQVLVRLFSARVFGCPAERGSDAVDVRVDWEVCPLESEEDDAGCR